MSILVFLLAYIIIPGVFVTGNDSRRWLGAYVASVVLSALLVTSNIGWSGLF